MLFIHTWEKVLSGGKTQTRRLSTHHSGSYADGAWFAVYNTLTGYPVWRVGKDYAVCPGRGKAQVARIRITQIRAEDVRNISDEDARAEGFETWMAFLDVWLSMHDKPMLNKWEHWIKRLEDRPAERYIAWALTFRLVE